jgi:hypothetical protein
VRTVAEPHSVAEGDAMRALGRCACAAVMVVAAWVGFRGWVKVGTGDQDSSIAAETIGLA